jgi:hypothetical protein
MQKSCTDNPTEYDCSHGIRLLDIIGNNIQDLLSGRFVGPARLFANCDCCGNTQNDAIGTGFNPQLFSEDFPRNLSDPGPSVSRSVVH